MIAGTTLALFFAAISASSASGMIAGEVFGERARQTARRDSLARTVALTRDAAGAGVLHLFHRLAMASGKIAEDRGQTPAVRSFGARLRTQHTGLQQQLLAWLGQNDETAFLLRGATAEAATHPALRLPRSLQNIPDRCFDVAFLRSTIALDSRGLRFIAAAHEGASAPALRRLLADAAATIRRQRAEARELLEDGQDGERLPDDRGEPPRCGRSPRDFGPTS